MRKARVFISCGQLNSKEKTIGLEVDRYFKRRGFDVYYAEKVHSPEALTEHIFTFLKQSEYFVFIDFKRGQITKKESRGSVFVNQEIAISTFLKIPGLGFYEKGVKREGILNYQIYNAYPFEDGTQIIAKLEQETKDWDPASVNELYLLYNHENDSKNVHLSDNPQILTDWWHLEVVNRNKAKHAFSCLAYVTKITNLESKIKIEVPSIELIWSGLGDYTVNIMADSKRELDAFFVVQGENKIRFQSRGLTTTNPRFHLPVLEKGVYSLEYSIVSSNFEVTSRKFILRHLSSHQEIEFKPEED